MPNPALTPGEQELERCLHGLKPSAHGLQHDQVIYQAGRRVGARSARAWQCLAGILIAALLGLVVVPRPNRPDDAIAGAAPLRDSASDLELTSTQDSVGHDASVHVPPAAAPSSPNSYLNLRQRVTVEGLDALPTPRRSPITDEPIRFPTDWPRLSRFRGKPRPLIPSTTDPLPRGH